MSVSFDKATSFLVVDDFDSMRKLVVWNLTSMGYTNVVQAANGREALAELEKHPEVKVVITDWNMPVMSGIELLRAIRGNRKFQNLPVLMITAEIARHQVQEAAEAGVSDFLVKPFTVGGLQNKLDKLLENLKRGVVAGLKQQAADAKAKANDGLNSALLGRAVPATPARAPAAQPPARQAAPSGGRELPPSVTTHSRPLAVQPRAGAEPLALMLTEDMQARMARRADILVVDDLADNIDVLVGLLQDDYKVRAAKSGDAALKMLANNSKLPDLILLDVMMPEMDGFEVCRRLKANPLTAAIPVIFLTAVDDSVNVVQGLELGAVDYVTKPANPTVLKVRVRNHLTRSQAFVELQKQYEVMADNVRLREDVERMTAHDLKNPIGGIINFTDMLLADDMMTNDQRELLRAVDESAHNLLNMVTLSLDLFKIEQGSYELQACQIDLVKIVRKVLREKGPEIQAKGLVVSNTLRGAGAPLGEEPSFTVQGDELLCYSMLSNLIKNAVEAAPPGGKLALVYAQTPDGQRSISICNGGAVPLAVRASFFDKYVTAGKKGGTGLGTYSARLLAEVQRGAIAMQVNDEDNETTVTVTLPPAN